MASTDLNSFSVGKRSSASPWPPGLPPRMPQGGQSMRGGRLRFQRPSTKLTTVVLPPSPPRYLPAPPESARSARSLTSTGHFNSIASIAPLRTSPWHTETVPDSPSSNGRPPQPPPSIDCITKRLPVFGLVPKNTTAPPSVPRCAAGMWSGQAVASAVTIVSTTVGIGVLHPAIGAG